MNTQETILANTRPTTVMRPLKILIPFIKQHLEAGNEKARQAAMEDYRLAGEALWEAKAQVEPGQWGKWLAKNFELSKSTAYDYMQLANYMEIQLASDSGLAGNPQVVEPKSLSSVTRPNRPANHPSSSAWYKPVQEAANRVNVPQMKREAENKQKEKELERKLGLQLIDIGYRVLAAKLHPDHRGGSAIAMARLNRVRAILKGAL